MNVSTDPAVVAQNARQTSVTRQPTPSEEGSEAAAQKVAESKKQESAETGSSGGNPPYLGQNLNVVG
ncbi:MAG: hypothetical protein HQL66_05830 [Magnetococcales bacterium]|nr:hypothetical protein [Magnetococcales bacterium]